MTASASPPRTTVLHALADRVANDPDGPYLDFDGDAWTAHRIDDASNRLAAAFAGLGVVSGDRMASLLENGAPQVLTFFAALKLGAIAVPINTALKGDFLLHQLADSGARVLVVQGDYVSRAAAVVGGDTPELESMVVVGEPDVAQAADIAVATHEWDALLDRSGEDVHPAEVAPGDLALFVYTAGTTGPSKGCMLPHNYVVSMASQMARIWERTADDVVWSPLPLFHFNAICACVVGPLLVGGSASVSRRFSVSGFWPAVKRSGATIASLLGSPAMLVADADDHPDMEGHSLRLCAAAPMPPATDAIWRERFGCTTFSAGFGMTEAGLLSLLPAGEANPPGAAGRLNDVEFEVRIVGDDGRQVPVGETGEIACRPRLDDVMFAGYWRRPEATEAVWRDGWFRTGDLGRADADGFLFFVDRKNDYLRRRGENISSFEMEKTLHAHDAIADVAAHAVPSELGEDDVKVTAVLVDGAHLGEEELCRWLAERVPYFAIPRYIEFRADLPRNPVGRVLKYQLRDEGVTPDTWDRDAAGVEFDRR